MKKIPLSLLAFCIAHLSFGQFNSNNDFQIPYQKKIFSQAGGANFKFEMTPFTVNGYTDFRNYYATGKFNFYVSGGTHGGQLSTLTINSNGNVGIGTTSPGYKLHVTGTGYFSDLLKLANNKPISWEGATYASIRNEGSYMKYGATSGHYFDVGGTRYVSILSSGNLGIGTTSPLSKLQVSLTSNEPLSSTIMGNSGLVVNGRDGNFDLLSFDDNSTVSNNISFGRYNESTGALIHKFGITSWANTGNTGSNSGDKLSFSYGTNKDIWGNANLMVLNANGSVGIGTDSPIGNLEVSDSGDAQFQITSKGNFGNAELSFLNSFDNYGFKQFLWNGGEQLHFNFGPEFNGGVNSTTNIMTLHGNGRIGIGTGTTSPGTKLEVFEPAGGTSNFIAVGASSYESMRIGVDDAGARIQSHSATQPIYFMTNGAERMQVASNGNVGIGTTSPSAALDIGAGTTPRGGYTDILIGSPTPQIEFYDTNESGAIVYEDNGLSFYTNGSPWVKNLFLKNDGNIGIGTDSPREKLEVNGNALIDGELYSKKVKVSVNPGNWPDYVFASSYELLALSEVEDFVKKNGHLPEVPSAQEVEKEGLDLGNMDATLLKKVEELTLYMIEMKKEIEVLKKEIEVLKKENKKLSDEVNKVRK